MIHQFPVRVYYEDTDFSGIVYHANYLRFAERGRSEYLRAIGIRHKDLLQRNPPLAFIVRAMHIDFLKNAQVEDDLIVETSLTKIGPVKFEMSQKIKRKSGLTSELIWQANTLAAIIDIHDNKPTRQASDIMAILKPYLISSS